MNADDGLAQGPQLENDRLLVQSRVQQATRRRQAGGTRFDPSWLGLGTRLGRNVIDLERKLARPA